MVRLEPSEHRRHGGQRACKQQGYEQQTDGCHEADIDQHSKSSQLRKQLREQICKQCAE
jgi:hypothetical protein